MIWNRFLPLLILAPSSAHGVDWYASTVISYSNLGVGIYGDPTAALGQPTRWVRDTVNGGANQQVFPSPGYAPWNVGPNLEPLVVTIKPGGQLTLAFTTPIQDAPGNWYGYDFIVFGNSILATSQTVIASSNFDQVLVLSGPDFLEPMQVSVSPNGLQWYSYPVTNSTGADSLWPTLAFNPSDGTPTDFTKPIRPTLSRSAYSGQSLNTLCSAYLGSGGGTAFDLRPSGFRSIKYIRITGNSGEVDAVARVSRGVTPVQTQISID